MNLEAIKDALVPISTFVALITASIGGWLALREYKLKARAETRLAKTAEIESDVKLLTLFTELMDIAHARGGSHVSEKAIERLLSPEMSKQLNVSAANVPKILESAVVTLPVGGAAQDAAIAAIWTLGKRHPILTQVAIRALESLSTFKGEVAAPYLQDLKKADTTKEA
jgi:uncharacterized membrane protein